MHSDEPVLSASERAAIDGDPWFSSLSPALRHDILRRSHVRRFRHGETLCARGDEALDWSGVARGAVRVSGRTPGGKHVTLSYVQPGAWIGDVAIFGGGERTHDASACGDTTLVSVSREALRDILAEHVELYEALLRLNASRLRHLFSRVEDLSALPLRARLAKQLRSLVRSHGIPVRSGADEVRIGLHLAQEELARLLGASRQRVNMELKVLERHDAIRIQTGGVVVRSKEALARFLPFGG